MLKKIEKNDILFLLNIMKGTHSTFIFLSAFLIVMFKLLTTAAEPLFETQTGTNPILDENGQFVSPEEAVNNITNLWEEWDIFNKLISALPKLILAVAILLFGLWLSKFVSNLVIKGLKAKGVDSSVYMFVKKIISVFIKLLFILFSLSIFININSFLAAIGAAGITAGIGLQDSVSQFASGIQILLNRPFKAGDYVEIDGKSGNVAEIRFMNTIITTSDNKRIIIPNSHITQNNIINYSAEDNRRVDLNFCVSYDCDFSKVKSVIIQTALSNEDILKDPMPIVYVSSHDASSIGILARVWCKSDNYWSVYYSMMEEVKLAFDKNSISIPYDQLDVHIVEQK